MSGTIGAPNGKIVVLTFLRFYLPGYKYGGPVRSVANLIEALGDEIDFRIVTLDRDDFDETAYPGVQPETWTPVGKAQVYYVPPARATFGNWQRLVATVKPDLVYLNSLFDPKFTLMPLLVTKVSRRAARKIVVAPRGELSQSALKLKAAKKSVFLRLAKLAGLYSRVWWHVSTADEAAMVAAQFGSRARTRAIVARNLSVRIDSAEAPRRKNSAPDDPLRVVFLSRIGRMKNLDIALRVLAQSTIPIEFDIWGPVADAPYWRSCSEMIETMPNHIRVNYRGVADHVHVGAIMADYDIFFLPTAGENFGQVIAEALGAGTPVLISDRTPWTGLEQRGVGWDLPLENGIKPFVDALERALERRNADTGAWRNRVKAFARSRSDDQTVVTANREVFAFPRGRNAAASAVTAGASSPQRAS
jgi:glycosyltransferase involved in cell wall biosynthesis